MKRRLERLGSAVVRPGELAYGEWPAWGYASGRAEMLPVVVARGPRAGPCLWITAGIHGDEPSGPAVLYELMRPELARELSGMVVALPALSPVGLRHQRYQPQDASANPNRLWPDPSPRAERDEDAPGSSSMEIAYAELFAEIAATADLLIDFHNAWPRSLSFAFRDRILFDASLPDAEARAKSLAQRQDEMLAAYGHTIVTEFPPKRYQAEELHRSLSAAVLLGAGIPSFTAELGPSGPPTTPVVEAAAAGARNVMRWAGMLDGPMEPIAGIPVVPGAPSIRRSRAVRAPAPGVVRCFVRGGDAVSRGDVLASLCDVWGRPIGDGTLRSPRSGFVLGVTDRVYCDVATTVVYLAVEDDAPRIAPFSTSPS